MRRSTDDLLKELYAIDKNNNYTFTYFGNTQWEVRNKRTQEGLYTDGGYKSLKSWLLDDIEKNLN